MPKNRSTIATAPLPTRLLRPLEEFLSTETIGGMLLLVAAVIAMIWANLPGDSYHEFWTSRVTAGVVLGLMLGKPAGILLFSWLAVRLGIAALPNGVKWGHIFGAGLIGGVGFTVSIFVAGLAFKDPALIEYAKIGILAGSTAMGILGLCFLYVFTKPGQAEAELPSE